MDTAQPACTVPSPAMPELTAEPAGRRSSACSTAPQTPVRAERVVEITALSAAPTRVTSPFGAVSGRGRACLLYTQPVSPVCSAALHSAPGAALRAKRTGPPTLAHRRVSPPAGSASRRRAPGWVPVSGVRSSASPHVVAPALRSMIREWYEGPPAGVAPPPSRGRSSRFHATAALPDLSRAACSPVRNHSPSSASLLTVSNTVGADQASPGAGRSVMRSSRPPVIRTAQTAARRPVALPKTRGCSAQEERVATVVGSDQRVAPGARVAALSRLLPSGRLSLQ